MLRIAILASLTCSASAYAQFSIVAIDRYVSTQAWSTVVRHSSTESGPWTQSVFVDGDLNNLGDASQTSLITPVSLSSNGFASVTDGNQGTVGLHSESVFDVTFDLSSFTPYAFTGSWTSTGGAGGIFWSSAMMKLERLLPDPEVFHYSEWNYDDVVTHGSAGLIGVFSPGRYHLRAVADIAGGTIQGAIGTDGSSHSINLTIPSPGALAILACAGLPLSRRRR